jgi:hypothetical protein
MEAPGTLFRKKVWKENSWYTFKKILSLPNERSFHNPLEVVPLDSSQQTKTFLLHLKNSRINKVEVLWKETNKSETIKGW